LNIQNGYIDFSNYALSTIAGLLKYALDKNPFFELDSNKELRNKSEDKNIGVDISNVVDDNNALHSIKLEKTKTKNSFFDKLGKWL
jgi:hypothetical protein